MANKMIIDASHPEETRVVVLKGNRVEEFDFESASKRPLRGNIYLAKVTRVEPSLQAAFVDYGGNRHGFLAFSEIHPDYYQIPVADRQALLEEEAASHQDEDYEPNGERRSRRRSRHRPPEAEARAAGDDSVSELAAAEDETRGEAPVEIDLAHPAMAPEADDDYSAAEARESVTGPHGAPLDNEQSAEVEPNFHERHGEERSTSAEEVSEAQDSEAESADAGADGDEREPQAGREPREDAGERHDDEDEHDVTTLDGGSEERIASHRKRREDEGEPVEQIGGDALEEVPRRPLRMRRQYKIQEVIKRRQVLLVQVVKEERGNKGAALTTYLSLAGRYSVLMPNTARGGGISRKITNSQDRSRLKGIAEELDVPEGMGVILRTAGASRTKAEVKRDFEYLLRMWETVRETTLASSAPTLVYEEGSLIKRAIRDLYSKEVDEIIVAGEAGHREARQFMRLLMPSHVNVVQLYRETAPVFAKVGVEAQLDAMFSNQVTLKSGGYIVINQTEALVAIDVNSGRSTREHNIEDTALRTNLEAADEVARQLRLRDLAGLIVVDFIDMEESRNNRAVERRIKDALKNDRARIQVGRISHFGLLEMSRQRIRTGVLEGSTVVCPHCQGAGVVRSTASIALHVLRILEDALIKSASHDVVVRTRTPVTLYILNHKRGHLRDLEHRFGVAVTIDADDTLTGANYHAIERGEPASGVKAIEPPPLAQDDFATIVDEPIPAEEDFDEPVESAEDDEPIGEAERESATSAPDDSEGGRRRRRRRKRRGGERGPAEGVAASDAPQPTDDGLAVVAEIGGDLSRPVVSEPNGERNGWRAEGGERGRRSRRSRGRHRYPRLENGPEEGPSGDLPFDETAEASQDATMVQDAAPPGHDVPAGETHAEFPPLAGEAAALEPGPVSERAAEAYVAPAGPTPAAPEPTAPADSAPVEADASEESTPAEPRTVASAEPALEPESAPGPDEPPRPRRSGWWQRARATLVGE
jgi:ribonuclease E